MELLYIGCRICILLGLESFRLGQNQYGDRALFFAQDALTNVLALLQPVLLVVL